MPEPVTVWVSSSALEVKRTGSGPEIEVKVMPPPSSGLPNAPQGG